MTLRAGIYGRNSQGEAKSIADQLKLGEDAVQREGWTLAGRYSDDTSASRYRTKERQNWARLVADIAAGRLDVIVLWKSARGSRDELDWFQMLRECRSRGVLIYVMADRRAYDARLSRDWKTLAEDGVNAAYYSDELSENVRRGKAMAAKDGSPRGVAFGYDLRYDPETKRPLRQPNANAATVRTIFEKVAKLTPIGTIAKDLNDRNVPSPTGKGWYRKAVRDIAMNIAYIGKTRVDGNIYDGKWPAIVEEDIYWQVLEILKDPKRMSSKPGKVKYLLSYVAVAKCGEHLSRKRDKRGGPDRYRCEHGCVSIPLAEADEVVNRMIVARLSQPDARDLYLQQDETIAAAHAEAARLRGQLEDARRSFESPDGISAEALARKERSLQPLITDAEQRARPAGVAGVLGELLSADDKAQAWADLHIAAKREVVSMLAHIVLGTATRDVRWADTETRLAEAWRRFGGSSWVGDTRTLAEIRASEGPASAP